MPSHKSNRWGTLAEKKAAAEHGIELSRAPWKDGHANGRPVEIKSTRPTHADGQPGNFKLYEDPHRRIRRESGLYCFVVYQPWGRGARILRSKIMHSSKLPRLSWHGGGEHRGTDGMRQAKLRIEEVF